MDDLFFAEVSEEVIRREKAKARELRKTSWWHRKISAGVCYFCAKQFSPKELTMDHLTPLARGGQSTKGNIVAACKECNTKKRSMLPIEWNEYMERLEK